MIKEYKKDFIKLDIDNRVFEIYEKPPSKKGRNLIIFSKEEMISLQNFYRAINYIPSIRMLILRLACEQKGVINIESYSIVNYTNDEDIKKLKVITDSLGFEEKTTKNNQKYFSTTNSIMTIDNCNVNYQIYIVSSDFFTEE